MSHLDFAWARRLIRQIGAHRSIKKLERLGVRKNERRIWAAIESSHDEGIQFALDMVGGLIEQLLEADNSKFAPIVVDAIRRREIHRFSEILREMQKELMEEQFENRLKAGGDSM